MEEQTATLQKQRERQLFDNLIRENLGRLNSLALQITKNPDDAEDLFQETAFKAFRFFFRFERGTNFYAWIYRIMVNTYINIYRKKKNKPVHVPVENVDYKLDSEALDFWEELDKNRHHEFTRCDRFDDEVNDAIERLPEEYQSVVILADTQDFCYKEIADTLDLKLGTVMSRIHRGRKQLQRRLRPYAVERGVISGNGYNGHNGSTNGTSRVPEEKVGL